MALRADLKVHQWDGASQAQKKVLTRIVQTALGCAPPSQKSPVANVGVPTRVLQAGTRNEQSSNMMVATPPTPETDPTNAVSCDSSDTRKHGQCHSS